jgi:hypothetical protein
MCYYVYLACGVDGLRLSSEMCIPLCFVGALFLHVPSVCAVLSFPHMSLSQDLADWESRTGLFTMTPKEGKEAVE